MIHLLEEERGKKKEEKEKEGKKKKKKSKLRKKRLGWLFLVSAEKSPVPDAGGRQG